eukprot:TRINITY_DN1229_c0_g1_i5.p1 TRINITY_DN1229_c0_g1~~TRINITY_DN1229_c0_g1_i5.p1  ORF type:complete len:1091 (-),score=250.98 TRINITY_DN1229_c0_g1_i5:266-3538(-)
MLQYRVKSHYHGDHGEFPPTELNKDDVVSFVREEHGMMVGKIDDRIVIFPASVVEPLQTPFSPGAESVGLPVQDFSLNTGDEVFPNKRHSITSHHSQTSYHIMVDDDAKDQSCWKQLNHKKSKMSRRQVGCMYCLLIGAIVAIIMFPLFFEVIGPQVAQSAVDQAQVDFKSVTITNPGTTTFRLSATGDVKDAGAIEGKTKPMDIEVMFDGKVLGTAKLPPIKAGPTKKTFNIDELFQITDMTLFDQFVRATIYESFVTWRLVGDAKLTASIIGIPITFEGIDFDKTSTLTAFNSFPNVELLVFDLTKSNATHINVDMQVNMYNPAVLNIDPLGNLEFDIVYKGARMGTLFAENVSVYMGPNILSMAGSIIPDDMDVADELFSRYLRGDDTVVSAVATENASSIELYREALVGLELFTTLKGQETELVQKIDFLDMFVIPASNTTVDLKSRLNITISNPLGDNSPLLVKTVKMRANLVYNGVVFGSVSTDDIIVEDGSQLTFEVLLDTILQLSDNGAPFVSFMESFINDPLVSILVSGEADVVAECAIGELKLTGLPVNVLTSLQGLNGIPGIEITYMDLPSNAPEGGVEVVLTALIPNPTIAGIALGDAVFDVKYKGVHFGYAFATNLTMDLGDNIVNMRGYILPDEKDLDLLSEFVSLYLGGVNTTVGVVGLDTSIGGVSISWLSDLVTQLELDSNLAGLDIELISSIDVNYMDVNFPSGVNPLSAASVVAGFDCPFDFPLFVYSVMMQVDLLDDQQQAIGYLDVPPQDSSSDQIEGEIYLSYENIPIQVKSEKAFSDLVSDILLTDGTSICMRGSSDSQVQSAMGNFTIANITIDICDVRLQGMNGLQGQIAITTLRVVAGPSKDSLNILIDLTINNQATLSASLGSVVFLLYYQGVNLGYSLIDDLVLGLGINPLSASAVFNMPNDPTQKIVAQDFLTKYLEGKQTVVELRGYEGSTNIPYLLPAMTQFATSAPVPGSTTPLINKVDIKVNLLDALFRGFILGKFYLENPMDADAVLSYIDFVVTYKGELIGSITMNLNPVVYIPAKQLVATDFLRVEVAGITRETIEVLIGAIGKITRKSGLVFS